MNRALLKRKIRAAGLKQKEVAAHLGITHRHLGKLMSGSSEFGVLHIRALMQLLQLSRDDVDRIFFGE